MKAVHVIQLLIVAVVGLSFASPAEARRRSKREGFNFGSSVRVLNTDSRTTAGEGSDKNTHTTSQSQLLSPYVGYAFEALNLGLVFNVEQATSESVEKSDDGLKEDYRNIHKSSKGASLFARFLFGKVFFFEAAGGIYEEKLNVKSETRRFGVNTSFEGELDEYEVKGIGPGYHVGAGLEFEMASNFFFTSTYQVRMVQLRDYEGGSELGAKRSFEQKREILFGIAHYHK